LAAGFAGAAYLFSPERLPDPVWVGGLAALAAGIRLLRPAWDLAAAACGGALAGVLAVQWQAQGLPAIASVIMAAAVPVTSAYLTWRSRAFAPARLVEEAVLLVLALGLLVATVPAISAGWQTARALNIESTAGAKQMIPAWVLFLSGAAAASGGIVSLWRHR
jgi:hypothetical protein